MSRNASHQFKRPGAFDLSEKERAAVLAYGEHGTMKRAARAVGVSPRTIDKRLESARDKLGVHSTWCAVEIVRAGA